MTSPWTPYADTLRADRPDLRAVDARMEQFRSRARDVHRVAELVILEGPESVVRALYRAVHAADDVAEVVGRMVRDAHAGETSRKAADLALAAEREHLPTSR